MNAMKKNFCSLFLIVTLVCSFQMTASAAEIATSTDPNTKTTYYAESGTFYIISGSLEVRNNLNRNSLPVATYRAGESFNYDYVVEVKDYNNNFTTRYVSYRSNSGVRRYVPFMTRRASGDQKWANYVVY